MKQPTEKQIEDLKILARKSTSQENCPDDWNPYEISGGNYDDAYWVGYNDADIENARFILDMLEIDY
jgi:hypothetical protein